MTHCSMEQIREPQNKATEIWSITLWQRSQEYTIRIFFSINGIGKTGMPHAKPRNWTTSILQHKQKSIQDGLKTWIRTWNCKTPSKLLDINLGNNLLDLTPKAKVGKGKINKWDYIKLKSFCTAKETINKMKRKPMEWEKIFVNHTSDKGLISQIYKEPI